MRTIRSKITWLTVSAIVVSIAVATVFGISSIRELGNNNSEKMLTMLCETGEKNLDHYFESMEQSVVMVASFAEADLDTIELSNLGEHVERTKNVFNNIAENTNGVLTYYYRIDPEVSKDVDGFWYIDVDGKGFASHKVTDISQYDTADTSKLVWYTVPKNLGKSVWLSPYVTENLDVLVLSYNVPVYKDKTFVGVAGIEIDYTTMANQVDNIRLFENGYAFINDDNGNIIYHPRIDVSKLTDENKPKVPEGLLSDKTNVRYTFEGVEKLGAWKKLRNGMRLNVSVPVSEITGNWRSLINKIVIVSVILLALAVVLTMRLAEKITKPLRKLTEAAKQVDEGNYEVELEHSGSDEVAVLSHTFGQLIEHQKEYINELNDLNQKLKDDNLTLEAATIRDSLTGVKNRFALRRDYDGYTEQEIHIMMLDIDDFKKVNDNYGHSVGDYLLKKTGDTLIDIFGAEHSYRYGGDEFMVIYPDIQESDFTKLVSDMGSRLEEIYLEDKKLPVHFSAGYVYGKILLHDDLRLMIRQADELLYKAKGSGKSTFFGESYDRDSAMNIKKKAEEAFRHG